MEQKATIDALFALALGLYTYVNPVPTVTGGRILSNFSPRISGRSRAGCSTSRRMQRQRWRGSQGISRRSGRNWGYEVLILEVGRRTLTHWNDTLRLPDAGIGDGAYAPIFRSERGTVRETPRQESSGTTSSRGFVETPSLCSGGSPSRGAPEHGSSPGLSQPGTAPAPPGAVRGQGGTHSIHCGERARPSPVPTPWRYSPQSTARGGVLLSGIGPGLNNMSP